MTHSNNHWLFWAIISGFLCVALGAFGAHALKASVSAANLEIWKTAVQYQMFHTLALMILGLLNGQLSQRVLCWIGRLWCAGLVLFCGSLYALVLTDLRWLGAITPLGGTLWLVAWALLAIAAFRQRRRQ